ncbi:MAG: hypothetical protein ABR502_05760 [Chitinophagaceae bacterium]
MEAGLSIHYLRNAEINKKLWDECIDKSENGLIYGYSFYLDAMCTNWDALVLNNYEAVMPLPWRKKYGFFYLYYPFLTAQLGLFGRKVTSELLENFLNNIPAKFRYWDFPLNYKNVFTLSNFELIQRSNYVLDLSKGYEFICKNYRQNL